MGGSVPGTGDSEEEEITYPSRDHEVYPEDHEVYPEIARGMATVWNRAWNGTPTVWSEARPSKQTVGALGEKLAMKVLAQKTGFPFEPVDSTRNNSPIDLWGDGLAVESYQMITFASTSRLHIE